MNIEVSRSAVGDLDPAQGFSRCVLMLSVSFTWQGERGPTSAPG